MRRKIVGFLAIFVAALAMSISTGAQATMLNVVASQSILADIASQVAGDSAEVRSLMPVGADPHTFTPLPSDLTAVAEADLVFLVGAGYEETLLEAIESAGEMVNIVEASACVQVIPAGASMHHEDEHADEHEDEHADEHEDEHADEHEDEHAHEHEDEDEHAHEDEDEHADEHEDEHADEHEDEHADEHEDEHADEHADEHEDEHADEHEDEHAHEHDDDHADDMNGTSDCDAHDAEVAAIIGEESAERGHVETLGREQDIDCGGGHGHEDEHGHDHGVCDPHFWMDPHNVIYWVLQIRDAMSAQDPDNADIYAANAAAYNQELIALESDFILPALVDLPVEKRVLVTSHEAFGYLATTYRFELIFTLAGISTIVEPSARDVAALIDVVRDEGILAVFGDTFAPQPIMSAIIAETGAELAKLYSDTLSDEAGPASTYLDYMRYNVSTIVEALSGRE